MEKQSTIQGNAEPKIVTSEKKPFTAPLLEKKDVALTEAGVNMSSSDFSAYAS